MVFSGDFNALIIPGLKHVSDLQDIVRYSKVHPAKGRGDVLGGCMLPPVCHQDFQGLQRL